MFIRLNRKGQSTLEYTVIMAVVVAAIIMMQVYVKRAVQGKTRDAADDIGSQYSAGGTTGTTITNRLADTNESIFGGAQSRLSTFSSQNQDINVNETTPDYASEPWPEP